MDNSFKLTAHLHGIMVIHYNDLLVHADKASFLYEARWRTNYDMLNYHIASYCDALVHDLITITEYSPLAFPGFIALHENSLPCVITIVEGIKKLETRRRRVALIDKLEYQCNVLEGVFMGMITDEYLHEQINFHRKANLIFL
jgi:hypothetical protein